jgi:tight adherence protein B
VIAALAQSADYTTQALVSAVLLAASAGAVYVGFGPVAALLARQEQRFDRVLRGQLLLDVSPRVAVAMSLVAVASVGLLGYAIAGNAWGFVIFAAGGLFLPNVALRYLARRRRRKLEEQLVAGIQTLAAGVRAGLNLVQGMEMIARDAPAPLRQEFGQLVREYEYGVPLDEAMTAAGHRIGSEDFRLVFSALRTHRERGGNLGDTLDRMAESLREIQRLEKRVESLTAQGRATARWLSALPGVILALIYFLGIAPDAVTMLFTDPVGRLILAAIVVLNIVGFLWIRKIAAVDI